MMYSLAYGEAHVGMQPLIRCEIVYATPEKQVLLPLQVALGTTAIELLRLSGIAQEFPNDNMSNPDLGVFSKSVEHDYVLEEGDRIEIYRALLVDPKEVRRQLAAEGRTMGKRSK